MGEYVNVDAVIEATNGLAPQDLQTLAESLLTRMKADAPAPEKVYGTRDGNLFRNGPANTQAGEMVSDQTLSLVKNNLANVNRSGVTTATGFIGYDLQMPAATLVPYMTPMLNETPREKGVGVDVHHWKAITDFFGGNGPQSFAGGVAEAGTPGFVSYSVAQMSNTFQTLAAINTLSFQAQWRGRQLEGDMRAKLTAELLYSLKLVEENNLINWSDYLWTPPPPLVTTAITGGTLVATNPYWFAITAVNAQGETLSTGILGPFTIASGTTGSIALTLFTVPNSTKYNVYAATSASKPAASAMWLQAAAGNFGGAAALNQPANPISGSFSATLTSLATSGTALSTVAANTAKVQVDGSSNILSWKGAQSLVYAFAGAAVGTGAGGLVSQIVQPAAATGFLALSDIQNLLLTMFNNARANPEKIYCSPADAITINNLVAANGETRVVVNGATPEGGQASLTAGFKVTKFLNQATGRLMSIETLPFLAQGTIIIGSLTFPYPVSGWNKAPWRIITNQDYYGIPYEPTIANPTQWGMGDFVDETVVNEYPGGWGLINGIVFH